ncbi:MAG: hypothetical protein K5912_01305, partial [Alphaproteobacteria bacterium]|nr:hypothetical protein [Alphaproteobacteria bacterium]
MPRIKEPIFLEDELDSKKTGVYIGYTRSELLAGPELKHNPSAKDLTKKFLGVAENIDGTAKKHDYQKKINTFGYAVLSSDCNNLVFGVKVTAP